MEWLRRKFGGILFHENWMIGWVDAPIAQSLEWTSCPKVRWIGPRSKKRYLADPFPWPGRDDIILCEEYDYATQRGSIKRLTLKGDAIISEEKVELPLPGHVSFPFLFAHEESVYCMVESGEARCLKILRWENDAFREFATPLENKAAADSVLFEHDGRFWIAYTDTLIGTWDNLNLCFATKLAGPWQQHPGNPVKRGTRTSRCAGTPFRHGGMLYRAAQDCSQTYGGAVCIMRVAVCTPEHYREEEVTRIAPEAGMNPHGFHTLSACGDKCLVDGKRKMFSLGNVLKKVMRKIAARA